MISTTYSNCRLDGSDENQTTEQYIIKTLELQKNKLPSKEAYDKTIDIFKDFFDLQI